MEGGPPCYAQRARHRVACHSARREEPCLCLEAGSTQAAVARLVVRLKAGTAAAVARLRVRLEAGTAAWARHTVAAHRKAAGRMVVVAHLEVGTGAAHRAAGARTHGKAARTAVAATCTAWEVAGSWDGQGRLRAMVDNRASVVVHGRDADRARTAAAWPSGQERWR